MSQQLTNNDVKQADVSRVMHSWSEIGRAHV